MFRRLSHEQAPVDGQAAEARAGHFDLWIWWRMGRRRRDGQGRGRGDAGPGASRAFYYARPSLVFFWLYRGLTSRFVLPRLGRLFLSCQNWGTHSQNWTGEWIPMLQAAVKAGVIFEAHASCGSSDPDDPAEQSKLAAFLIGAGDGSYYLCGGWGSSSVPWFPIYDLPLGAPLSDAVLGADGVWRRSFKAGTNVTMDSKTQTGRISWGGRSSPKH